MNRKEYQGFMDKTFCFLVSDKGIKDELGSDIFEHIHVKVEWFPKGYKITESVFEMYSCKCVLEKYPFRKSQNDVERIALFKIGSG